VRWKERRTRAEGLLKRVGAEFSAESEVRALSMPEQQLVEIAKALGAGARILIMDEPTASLTQKEVQLLLQVVRDLRAQGVGIIYISHRLEEIFEVADRVTVLRDGESLGTHVMSAVDSAMLIRLMVGRDVEAIYPPATGTPGKVVLEVDALDAPAAGVNEVSFSVRAGEILCFAGLVGAGRTELARVLFGIAPAQTGTIRLEGKEIGVGSPREAVLHGIAYVPEDRRKHGVILEMPVAANATMAIHERIFAGGWLRMARERQLANEYVRDLGIKTASVESPAGTLSGGNQQKVALARWLATKPRVLILDEPTQGVDIGAKAEIHRILRALAAEGLAIILISSDLPEILGMSDRIAVMRGGRIVATLDGSADAHAVMAAALGTTDAEGTEAA
jgi:rhamnose transport system ATP-binding protein